MPSIYNYQKYIDAIRTVELNQPVDATGQRLGTELATVDGVTYVAIPNDATLPTQPTEITVNSTTLTDELTQAIKRASPHCKLIARRTVDKIRERYSSDDEMYLARIGVGAANSMYQLPDDERAEMVTYGEFVEAIRQWGREERAKLGL